MGTLMERIPRRAALRKLAAGSLGAAASALCSWGAQVASQRRQYQHHATNCRRFAVDSPDGRRRPSASTPAEQRRRVERDRIIPQTEIVR